MALGHGGGVRKEQQGGSSFHQDRFDLVPDLDQFVVPEQGTLKASDHGNARAFHQFSRTDPLSRYAHE